MRSLGSVIGIDAALNHSAVVYLEVLEGTAGPMLTRPFAWIATQSAKNWAVEHPLLEIHRAVTKLSDDLSNQLFLTKLAFWKRYSSIVATEAKRRGVVLCGIEDFAQGASQGAHQLGAANATLRSELLAYPFREIPISAVKSAGAGYGGASKEEVSQGLVQRSIPELAEAAELLDIGLKNKDDRHSYYDLFDAATIACILAWELWVRKTGQFQDAPEKIRRELLRVNHRGASPAVSQELVSPTVLLDRHFAESEAKMAKKKGKKR